MLPGLWAADPVRKGLVRIQVAILRMEPNSQSCTTTRDPLSYFLRNRILNKADGTERRNRQIVLEPSVSLFTKCGETARWPASERDLEALSAPGSSAWPTRGARHQLPRAHVLMHLWVLHQDAVTWQETDPGAFDRTDHSSSPHSDPMGSAGIRSSRELNPCR